MFRTDELRRMFPLLCFWGAYTLLFLLWVKTFLYTLPFLLGVFFAALSRPAARMLEKRFSLPPRLAGALGAGLVLTAVFGVLFFLGAFAVKELTAFIQRVTEGGFDEFSRPVADFFTWLGKTFQSIDLRFLEQNREDLLALLQNSFDLFIGFFGGALRVMSSLPAVAAMVIVTVCSTFIFTNNLGKLRAVSCRFLSGSALRHLKSAAETSGGRGRRTALAYLLLYFLTFCEAAVILSIFELPYPLMAAFLTAVADLLPVLGPGFVFLPMAVYQLLLGHAAKALGLLIGWGVMALLRQIIEPRLISKAVKVPALGTVAAIYFSLLSGNLWLLFYVLGFFMLYSAFRETGALPALLPAEKETPPGESGAV